MKKMFTKAFSLFTSAALLISAAPLDSAAEELFTEDFITEYTGEALSLADCNGQTLQLTDRPTINANYRDGAYNLGYYLDENNAAVYMAFMELINPSTEEFSVTLPEPIVITTTSRNLNLSDEPYYSSVFGACKSGIDSADFDIPELFWIDNSKITVSVQNVASTYDRLSRKYTYTIDKLYFSVGYYDAFGDMDGVMEYKEKLAEAVDNFEVQGSTRYEQLKSIHDTISKFTYYDINADFAHSCIGGLVEPGAVCEGYSKAFKIICDKLQIPCVCIFGNYDETENSAHMWNYVQMEDGNWYGVDVTWDDYDGSYGYETIYDFFMKGSNSFFEKHTEVADYKLAHLTYPVISKTNFDPKKPIVTTSTTSTTTSTTTTTTTTTTTARPTTTTTKAATTTTTKPTTTTTKATTTTTTRPTTTTTKATTTTTTRPTTTTTKATTTTTTRPTTTTTKATTTTTTRPTTTTTKATTTTTTKPTTTTTKATTTTTTKPTTTTTKATTTTTTTKATITTTKATTTTTTTKAVVYMRGDTNLDGRVSIADLVFCANHVLGKVEGTKACDLNDDNIINAYDVVEMRKIICSFIFIVFQ